MVTNFFKFNNPLKTPLFNFGDEENTRQITNFNINKTKFMEELEKLAKSYCLGEVKYNVEYDANIPEKYFSIDVPKDMDLDKAEVIYEKIFNDMISYSKRINAFDFFRDIYIIFNY